MIIKASRWDKEDYLETQFCLHCLVLHLYSPNINQTITFEDLVWCIARINKKVFEQYCIPGINIEVFNLFDIPNKIKQQTFKPTKKYELVWLNYISDALERAIRDTAKQWNFYGKYLVRFNKLFK